MNSHPTTEQNRAHRADTAWIKSQGRSFDHDGEHYISEYVNAFTGWAIRKSWKMTGHDWHVFNAAGTPVGREHSLTYAKLTAAVAS